MQQFDIDKGVEDLRATLHTFKGHAHCTGKVGVLGYCLGGKLAWLMGTRSGTDCSVGYYGVGIETLLNETTGVKKPVMLHIAEQDEYVPPSAQTAIHAALDKNPLVTLYDYPGAKHAFSRGNGINFNAEAAKNADSRTLAFLREHLGAA